MSSRDVIQRQAQSRADPAEDLRRERDTLLDFIENATVPLHRVGPDGTILWANRAELEALGYDRDEYVGHPIAEFHADRPVIEDILARLGRGEELHDYPARLLRKDGSIRHVLISSNVYFRDGEFVSTRCFTRDITEQRTAEEKLQAAVAFRRAIEEAAPAGLAACDLSGRQTYVNPSFAKLVGWDEEELVGAEPPFVYWPPEETDAIREAFEKTLRGDIPEGGFELRFQRRGGERFDALVLVSPIREAGGESSGWLASVSDITERKRTEERLARQSLEARLFHQATALAAETDSLEEALRSCVETVCELTGWPVGHAYVVSSDGSELVSARVWHVRDAERWVTFQRVTEETRFAPGAGLPGRIWERGEPVWMTDIGRDEGYIRRQAVADLGVMGSFGFPIRIRGRTEAVLEFFNEDEAAPDEHLLTIARSLGEQVGRVMERRRAAAALGARVRQQDTVAFLGARALEGIGLQELMDELVARVAETLDVEFSKVLELRPGGKELLLRAGIGWSEGLVGAAEVPAGLDSQAGYTLQATRPVIVTDLEEETRFSGPALLRDHGVVSGMSVVIPGAEGRAWGVLGAHTPRRREFGRDDLNFLQAVAHVLATAIQRRAGEEGLRERNRLLETLHRSATTLAAELDLEKVVQTVTDAGTELTRARFGAFFYNVEGEDGETYLLYSLSGASREAFADFPMPRNTEIFAPTFRGDGPVRIEDVRQDPRYARNSPYHGLPPGHLPVRSYLAVPVVSRTGAVIGGLFFGHEEVAVFTEESERVASGLAAQAAIAIDNARLYGALQEREAELRAIFENAAVGVAQLDLEGRWLMVNNRLCEILGRSQDEILTRNFREFTHPDDLDESLRQSQRLLEGEAESYTLEERYVRKGGEPVWVEATISLSRDEETGEPRSFVAVIEDISESKRATEALVFLAEASEVLVSSLDYQKTLATIARLAVPRLADWCAVDVLHGDKLERLALTHVDPDKAAAIEELHRRYPPRAEASHGPPRVVREGSSELVPEVIDELLMEAAEDEEHLELLRRPGIRSFLSVPLMVRGDPVGALTFASAESGRRYGEKDLALAEEVARRAATAIDNARLYRAAQEEILERKRSEEALRESEERLRFTLDAVRVGTWDWDMRTGKVRWSENLEAIHELEPGSFDGRFESFIEDVLPEDREGVRKALQEAIEETGDYHVEYRLNRPGRPPVWVEGRGRVILDSESGKPSGMTGVCADITARKVAEESRARLAAIAESSSDAILAKSLDGIITDWNKGAERMYGYTVEEAVGSPVSMLFPPDRSGELSVIFDNLRRGERFEQYETVRLRKDGTAIDVSLTVSPLRDSSGAVIGAATIARDITEKKRYEAALERANQELRHKNQELEQFVYSVSHDLKSPLVTTIGFLGLLKEDLANGRTEAVGDAMARIERAAQRMGQLIDDLLQLSRIGRLQNRPEEVDVSALVKEICEDLGPRIEECGAVVEVAEDMPRVVTDRARLGEVFENLLTNALKYGPDGSSPLKIEVGGRSKGGRARFYVRDNGAGIAPEYHERIFGLFERLHSREEGTGIGLAICRRIMEVAGGSLSLESDAGKGACFWLEFPAPSA